MHPVIVLQILLFSMLSRIAAKQLFVYLNLHERKCTTNANLTLCLESCDMRVKYRMLLPNGLVGKVSKAAGWCLSLRLLPSLVCAGHRHTKDPEAQAINLTAIKHHKNSNRNISSLQCSHVCKLCTFSFGHMTLEQPEGHFSHWWEIRDSWIRRECNCEL